MKNTNNVKNTENTEDTVINNTIELDKVLKELPINWQWMLGLGIFMLILGTLGLGMTVVLTITSVLFFGILMGTGGIIQIIQGIQAKEKGWVGRGQHFLIALLYLVTAGIIFWNPIAASQSITLLLAALFATMGIIRIYHAIRCKRNEWKWVLPVLLGIINLILSAVIIIGWPITGLWVIGLFVAIELIMNGWFLTLLALRVKKTSNKK